MFRIPCVEPVSASPPNPFHLKISRSQIWLPTLLTFFSFHHLISPHIPYMSGGPSLQFFSFFVTLPGCASSCRCTVAYNIIIDGIGEGRKVEEDTRYPNTRDNQPLNGWLIISPMITLVGAGCAVARVSRPGVVSQQSSRSVPAARWDAR